MNILRFLCAAFLILTVIFLSGCWDYTEYEDMALISAIGFDSGPNAEITVTFNYTPTARSQTGGAGQGQSQPGISNVEAGMSQASDLTISCAIDKLQQIIAKQIFLGYARVIVIGSQVNANDLRKIVSFLDTTSYIRPSTFLAVSKGKAADLLAIREISGTMATSQRIMDLLTNTSRSGAAFPVTVQDLFKTLDREGFELVMPVLEAQSQPPKNEDQNMSVNNSAGDGDQTVLGVMKPKPGSHKISGMTVFKGYRMTGSLDEKEALGWGWIRNQPFNGHLCLQPAGNPSGATEPEPVSFRFTRVKIERKVLLSRGIPEINLKVKVKAVLEEYRYPKKELPPASFKKLEKELANRVKNQLEKTIAKAQRLRSDIFGFGFDFYQQHTREWQQKYRADWDRIFPELPVQIKVKAEILSTGTKIPTIQEK